MRPREARKLASGEERSRAEQSPHPVPAASIAAVTERAATRSLRLIGYSSAPTPSSTQTQTQMQMQIRITEYVSRDRYDRHPIRNRQTTLKQTQTQTQRTLA